MKLLLDEMHAPSVAVELRARGYDTVAVKEGSELTGLSDPELLAAATAEGRAVVTENVRDFAALAQRWTAGNDRHAGLVFTHPRRFRRAARNHIWELAEALGQFLDVHAGTLGEVDSFVWWLDKPRR